jgi:hypothetical protein
MITTNINTLRDIKLYPYDSIINSYANKIYIYGPARSGVKIIDMLVHIDDIYEIDVGCDNILILYIIHATTKLEYKFYKKTTILFPYTGICSIGILKSTICPACITHIRIINTNEQCEEYFQTDMDNLSLLLMDAPESVPVESCIRPKQNKLPVITDHDILTAKNDIMNFI